MVKRLDISYSPFWVIGQLLAPLHPLTEKSKICRKLFCTGLTETFLSFIDDSMHDVDTSYSPELELLLVDVL